MKIREFKEYEVYSRIVVPPSIPFIIRCDGRTFHRLEKVLSLERPFDERFMKCMVEAAKVLFREGFNPFLAYVFSDEVNYVFTSESIFSRRVEKLDSIVAGILSSALTLQVLKNFNVETVVSFDARVVPMKTEEIVEYLAWRQSVCWRNCLNAYAFKAMIDKGMNPREAQKRLNHLKGMELHDLIYRETGINIAEVPSWQRRGVIIKWKFIHREGYDELRKEKVVVRRRILEEVWEVTLFTNPEGVLFLRNALAVCS
ncbi:MAG: tRNA 5'-guanylyltransferase [Thermoprotei archaeon]|nr:MAG: tRNA 5'-guanylyltransferase [Thermoprotei archaeon]